ncbi:nucleoside 2-deoxyribosyltransferase [Paenibacillus sp. R14(2021)]|uniref:nucleoside 2-deoxyribosyltransferase n=1 Tax=Paenibacillus sp. R14(2021) TaxID=2859228 RepID=UPI001C615039|nr:nucleoside 2-deoxyribosyltransferase [Paenibacillus sp. R14(2021)]
MQPKVYMAGFEVFQTDAVETGVRMKQLCKDYGFEGIFPLDKDITPQPDPLETAKLIFDGNVKLVQKADIIIANLNPFRGKEPDSGTVFECGLGYGLGKKLYGFLSDNRAMAEKLLPETQAATGLYEDGMRVENFGLPVNVMLSIPITIVEGTLEDALKQAREDLLQTR